MNLLIYLVAWFLIAQSIFHFIAALTITIANQKKTTIYPFLYAALFSIGVALLKAF